MEHENPNNPNYVMEDIGVLICEALDALIVELEDKYPGRSSSVHSVMVNARNVIKDQLAELELLRLLAEHTDMLITALSAEKSDKIIGVHALYIETKISQWREKFPPEKSRKLFPAAKKRPMRSSPGKHRMSKRIMKKRKQNDQS